MAEVVGYCRVSTEAQGDGYGLDVQRQQLTEWASEHGHRLVGVFEDETSGTNGLDRRLGLADALETLARGGASMLVVPKLDRLARDLVLQEQLLADVWRTGADICSCASGEDGLRDDPEDPSRRLIRQVLGAVSEYERSMISLRMRRGRQAKAQAGGYAGGAPPYGWRSDGHGGLVQVADEQSVLQVVRRMGGASCQEVADYLNALGHTTKRGAAWRRSTVSRLRERMSSDLT